MKRLFIIIMLLFLCDDLLAAPSITTVTGTISQGQTMTISGTFLMNENNTNWLAAFKSGTKYGFEGASYTADNYAKAGIDGTEGTYAYDSTVKLAGSKSYKSRLVAGQRCAGLTTHDDYLPVGTYDVYFRGYFRWHSAGSSVKWPDTFLKMLASEGYDGSFEDQMYFQPAMPGDSVTYPSQMNMQYDSTPHNINVSNFLMDGRWYCMEARFKHSSPAHFTVWVDGVQIGDAAAGAGSVGQIGWIAFNMINQNTGVSGDYDMTCWSDNVTLSTSRVYPSCMVEVGNSPTYNAATVVKQALTSISDTSVAFTLDVTGLGTGPYYVWVTDNRQARNGTPYQLGSSSGSAPVADFTASVTSGNAPLTVTFTDTSTNTPTSWAWDFGQNTFPDSTSQNPSKTFNVPGTYTVSLTATNAYGSDVETKTAYITVSNPITVNAGTLLFSEDFELGDSYAATNWPVDGAGYPTTASEYHSGSRSLQMTWDIGDTSPNLIGGGNENAGTLRHNLTSATDELYVSMWVKVSSNWVGSANAGYHPHLLMFLSDEDLDDSSWEGLAFNHTNFYVEVGGATGRIPRLCLQDGKNIVQGSLFTDLCDTTETRAVNGCNGDCDSQGLGGCYDSGDGTYWNGRLWDAVSAGWGDTNWHHVEAYIKMNTISGGVGLSDGSIKYWYDGSLVIDENEIIIRTNQYSTMGLQQIVLGPWIGDGSTVQQTMYIDDIAVYDGLPSETPSSPATCQGCGIVGGGMQ